MALETNPYQGIINAKISIGKFVDMVEAVSTPATTHTIRYGSISLNTVTGLLKYKNNKPIILRKSTRTYPIMTNLITNGGKETTYTMLAEALNTKDTNNFRLNVRTTIKDIRRRLKINSSEDPESNIFIATGKGYILAS